MTQTNININPKRLTLRRRLARGFMATETIVAFFASTGLLLNDFIRSVFFNLEHTENSVVTLAYSIYALSVVVLIFALVVINHMTTNGNYEDEPNFKGLTLREQLTQDVAYRRDATKFVVMPALGAGSVGFNLSLFSMLSETRFWQAIVKFMHNVAQVIVPIFDVIGVFSVVLLVSFGVYKMLYVAVKWTVWNGYTTDFVGLTIAQNVKRIRRVPGLADSLSFKASPNTVSSIIQANRAEILKYRKWYEMY
jgi:hypothetical protein